MGHRLRLNTLMVLPTFGFVWFVLSFIFWIISMSLWSVAVAFLVTCFLMAFGILQGLETARMRADPNRKPSELGF